MNQKILGFIYGLIFSVVSYLIYTKIDSSIIIKTYLLGAAASLISGCILLVVNRKRFIKRNYKRDTPKFYDYMKKYLRDKYKTIILQLLFFTALSWMSWIIVLIEEIEDRLNLN